MLVYFLHTPWKFEMSVGSKTDGSVNWAGGVQRRVREFAAVILDTETERVRFAGPQQIGRETESAGATAESP